MATTTAVEDYILTELSRSAERSPRTIRRLKRDAGRRFGTNTISHDRLLARYRHLTTTCQLPAQRAIEELLRVNSIRSESGVATVTVLTKPFPCPGQCTYCPTEARVPKSYLSNEPAVLRAIRNEYDPYRQVRSRLTALANTGHPTDKVELIIKGGTWSAYSTVYQTWFVQRCLDAANGADPSTCTVRHRSLTDGLAQDSAPRAEPAELHSTNLDDAQCVNETAAQRIIGTTIETRPDWVTPQEIVRLRRLGVTRVELGVQTLQDDVLSATHRGHDTTAVISATTLLKNAGFKVAFHLMPGLPGATPDSDLDTIRRLFAEPSFQPDTLKLYPCVVVNDAELAGAWRRGAYQPYDEETLIQLLMRIKPLVPPYVRIERIIRDIPTPSILAGCRATNLRQLLRDRLRGQPWICHCIRCREPRRQATSETLELRRIDYHASGGREIFLAFEDPAHDRLYAFLRLRLPGDAPATVSPEADWRDPASDPLPNHIASPQLTNGARHLSVPGTIQAARHVSTFPELRDAALIRELHTYGALVPIAEQSTDAPQHRGLGRRLMAEAERIAAAESDCHRIAVIAGVGVRDYYRKLGYELTGTYMTKALLVHGKVK